MSVLSENIKRLRRKHRLTHKQLADALELQVDNVHSWEKEATVPTLQVLWELAWCFHTTMQALYSGRPKGERFRPLPKRGPVNQQFYPK